MNKKMRELLAKIKEKNLQARKFQNEGKVAEAKQLIDEINDLKMSYENEKALFEMEKKQVPDDPKNATKANGFKAMAKIALRKKLTEAENALVTGTSGTDGENFLVPEDVDTTIRELRKTYKSAKDLVTVVPTSSLTGSFVFEKGVPTGLADFEDGSAITEETNPTFEQKKFQITHKGKIFPISNILLESEKAGLTSYLNNWFVKNSIISENTDIFDKLKDGKTVKAIKGLDELKSSINKDLDPSALIGAVIVTNQTGFDIMDSETDAVGRPILKEDYANPTQKLFQGLPVVVFPDSQLPNVKTGQAPIFYGNLKAGCYFIDKKGYQFATSTEYKFNMNMTTMRVIESYDVIQADSSTYIYGTITAAEGKAVTTKAAA
jgi:HK97 family phage major capsid protein